MSRHAAPAIWHAPKQTPHLKQSWPHPEVPFTAHVRRRAARMQQLQPSHLKRRRENAAGEDRTPDLRIMRPTRCQLRYCRPESAAGQRQCLSIRLRPNCSCARVFRDRVRSETVGTHTHTHTHTHTRRAAGRHGPGPNMQHILLPLAEACAPCRLLQALASQHMEAHPGLGQTVAAETRRVPVARWVSSGDPKRHDPTDDSATAQVAAAAGEDRTHDLRIMRPTRCQLR